MLHEKMLRESIHKHRCYTVYKDYCHFLMFSIYLNDNRLESYLQQTENDRERYIETLALTV